MTFEEALKQSPAIAILRGIRPEEMLGICEILREEKLRLLEVPLNSPDAVESIRRAAARYHADGELMIGAGTVLTAEAVRQVADAGGKFIIAPDANADVIRETKRLGLVSIPGFVTPTEAFAALRAGADYLKLFPAGVFGTGYIKDLKAVIPAPILAVGGVSPENLGEFLKVCPGAGIGSALYKPGKSPDAIRETARKLAAVSAKE